MALCSAPLPLLCLCILGTLQALLPALQSSRYNNRMSAAAAAARRADGISLAKATWPLQVDTDRIVAPKLSKSDAAFQTEGCDFVWGGSDLSIEELNKLFVRVSFLIAPLIYVIW